MDLEITFGAYSRLLEEGKYLEVIEQFYADDIEQVENYDLPIKGKESLHQQEKKNLASVHSVHGRITSYAINKEKGIVAGEMFFIFESKNSGKKKLEEAFVQRWVDGKIIHQRFYYKGFI